MMKKVFYWLPRVLAIFLIGFMSMFALDVIGEPGWLVGLLIHLIPSYFLVAITIVAWRNEVVGGFLFILAGFGLLIFTHFEAIVIAVPIFIVGVLFLIKRYLLRV